MKMMKQTSNRSKVSLWMKSGLSRKMLSVFPVLIVFILLFVVFAMELQTLGTKRYNQMIQKNTIVNEISREADEMNKSLQQYLLTKNVSSLEEAHDNINSLERLIHDLQEDNIWSKSGMLTEDIRNMTTNMIDYANLAALSKINRQTGKCLDYYEQASNTARYISLKTGTLNKILLEETDAEMKSFGEQQRVVFYISSILFLLLFVEIGLYIILYTGDIIRPVIQMAEAAKQISSGDFNTPDVEGNSVEEVILLTNTFNTMKKDINAYIQKIEQQRDVEKELHKKETENINMQMMLKDARFTALSSQIQPHFLFNTLNTGMQIAYMEGADQTVEFLDNMSGLLRYNLRNVKNAVSLRQEIEQVERYLYILHQRFGEMMEYNVENEIPEERLEQILMPGTILQPIVENSYAHGIRNLGRKGQIRVRLFLEDGRPCVSVWDNGCGASEKIIAKILSGEMNPGESGDTRSAGIGLTNVINRLKSYYGRDDIIQIDSKEDEHFRVTLRLAFADGGDRSAENEAIDMR